jgi:hypothetical protein
MYVHTYVHTYIHIGKRRPLEFVSESRYIHRHILTYIDTYLHTSTHTYIHRHIPTYIHMYIFSVGLGAILEQTVPRTYAAYIYILTT